MFCENLCDKVSKMKNLRMLQCNQSKDNNIWDRYYSNMREKIEIPALWVVLEFPKVFPDSEIFHFFGREKRQNRRSSFPVRLTNSVKKRDPF